MNQKKYSRLVMTTGISALSTRNLLGSAVKELCDGRSDVNFSWKPDYCGNGDWRKAAEDVARSLAQGHGDLFNDIDKPKSVSAEYSAISSLANAGRLTARSRVVLLHTETFEGTLAALLLKLVLESQFETTVSLHAIEDLDASDAKRLNRSLGIFLHAISVELGDHGNRWNTCFVPLGGYKVMTSLGYLTGAIHGYPSLYLYEDAQVPHVIPPFPITLGIVETTAAAPLLRRIQSDTIVWRDELSELETEKVSELPWLFETTSFDGRDALIASPFGEYFIRRYPQHFGRRVVLSHAANEVYESDKEGVGRAIRKLVELLEHEHEHDNRGLLHHEVTFGLRKKPKWHCCKLPRQSERIVWNHSADKPFTIEINHIWTNHDAYEREMRSHPSGLYGRRSRYWFVIDDDLHR